MKIGVGVVGMSKEQFLEVALGAIREQITEAGKEGASGFMTIPTFGSPIEGVADEVFEAIGKDHEIHRHSAAVYVILNENGRANAIALLDENERKIEEIFLESRTFKNMLKAAAKDEGKSLIN